jgi:hypothetical protein
VPRGKLCECETGMGTWTPNCYVECLANASVEFLLSATWQIAGSSDARVQRGRVFGECHVANCASAKPGRALGRLTAMWSAGRTLQWSIC